MNVYRPDITALVDGVKHLATYAFVKKETPSLKKEHVLTIFFDLEKAYDSVEARHSGGPLGSWFMGPSPQVYSELPV